LLQTAKSNPLRSNRRSVLKGGDSTPIPASDQGRQNRVEAPPSRHSHIPISLVLSQTGEATPIDEISAGAGLHRADPLPVGKRPPDA
jgi:hypothetical protein